MALAKLWVEEYRPTTLDKYVFRDNKQKEQIEQWIKDKSIPHLLFSGNAGGGKTTLAKILINELGILGADVELVNGSKEGRKIDWLRDRLDMFCQTMPFGDYKVVLLDEADYLNATSVQPALRNLMETNSQNVRFILTCNYPHRIIPPIHSRCQHIVFEKPDMNEFITKLDFILKSENIKYEDAVLATFIDASYPDFRKCINNIQLNCIGNELMLPDSNSGSADYRIEMVNLFNQGKINAARKLLCSQARPEEMEEIYRWLYDHIELFGDSVKQQDTAVLIIKQGLVDHTICADAEVNLAATLIRLARNKEQA